jgi:ATP adenylyltransferase
MEVLWAPWRMEYIRSSGKKASQCLFCDKLNNTNDRENLVLYRSRYNFVVMNPYPYNNGHLLILPNMHVPSLKGLDDNTLLEFMRVTQHSIDSIKEAFMPEGFNIGMNLGKVAGAGLGEHVHLHIIPRWTGDTSFMTVIGEVRVIPEHIISAYDKLFPIFNSIKGESQKL